MSFLSTVANTASYLLTGSHPEPDQQQIQENNDFVVINNTNNNSNSNNYQNTPVIDHTSNIVCSANGELWKFASKREQFEIFANKVQAQIIECDLENFESLFQVLDHRGQVLFAQKITNDLRIQFNKNNHSMVFAHYVSKFDKSIILSLVFSNEAIEAEFKKTITIKLYEFNAQQMFSKLFTSAKTKEYELACVQNSFEMQDQSSNNANIGSDLQTLDENVQLLTTHSYMDLDSDPEDNERAEEKANRWQKAADTPINDYNLEKYQSNEQRMINTTMDDTLNSNHCMNKMILGSKVHNRTYIVRKTGMNNTSLGFLKHNESNELEYQGKIDIKDMNNQSFTPLKTLQFKSDSNMLMLDESGKISLMDLRKGKIVEEWQNISLDENNKISDISSLTKHEQMTDNPLIYGLNRNTMFLIDSRMDQKAVDSKCKKYKSKIDFSCIATSGQGFIATGSENGNIRLYDTIGKKAKTRLLGLGDDIRAIEISNDGLWILATCKDYILVIPTIVPNSGERTGFEGRGLLNKEKPQPFVLRLKLKDLVKYQLCRNVNFTDAHFDVGNNNSFEEHWIVTSTGSFIIKWNFRKLKEYGICDDYSIRRADSKIVNNEFRFNFGDELLVSEIDAVYAQHSSSKV